MLLISKSTYNTLRTLFLSIKLEYNKAIINLTLLLYFLAKGILFNINYLSLLFKFIIDLIKGELFNLYILSYLYNALNKNYIKKAFNS
jgi:hypothetical protein